MNCKKEVSVKKIINEAEESFRNGFYCSEAIISVIRNNFELDIPEEIIAMASGFPIGIGASKDVCGALTGGIMALGLVFGRTKQKDPKVAKTLKLSKEAREWFINNNGKNSTCCKELTKEFDMKKGGHREQCIKFTGMMAGKIAEQIIRENNLVNLDGIDND